MIGISTVSKPTIVWSAAALTRPGKQIYLYAASSETVARGAASDGACLLGRKVRLTHAVTVT